MELPEDIAKAENCIPRGLDDNHYRSTLRQYIASALAAERLSATERAAEIAEASADAHDVAAFKTESDTLVGLHRQAERTAKRIAAAIRSQP